MSKNHGLVERLSLDLARYIKENGGHPNVSVGTMRFALHLWISILLTIILTCLCGLILGKAPQSLSALAAIGILRYFSGGWHFRNLDVCIFFTTAVAVSIPLFPIMSEFWLILMNIASLALVLWLSPTGHGQKFKSSGQRTTFKWIAAAIVILNFLPLFQILAISFLCQSFTLITLRGGDQT